MTNNIDSYVVGGTTLAFCGERKGVRPPQPSVGTPRPRHSQGKHNQRKQPQTQRNPETIRKSKTPNLPVWTHTHRLVSRLFPSGPFPPSPRAHPVHPPQFTVLPGLPSATGGRLSSSAWRWRPCVVSSLPAAENFTSPALGPCKFPPITTVH